MPCRSLPFASAYLLQEVVGEQRDVARPLAQRRDVDLDHVQAVEEVLAEAALLELLLEVAVGGGHDAHVHLEGLVAAHALELALLQEAQQLDLHGRA